MLDTASEGMAADIYTKAFSDPDKYQSVCDLINVFGATRLDKVIAKHIAHFDHRYHPLRAHRSLGCVWPCHNIINLSY